MLRAQDYDAATLRRLLPGIEFEAAIETIRVISEKSEDKQMYDQREKAQRDYEWALSGAREEGKLAGKIQMLQELLGDPLTPDDELVASDFEKLQTRLAELQQRLRDRPNG